MKQFYLIGPVGAIVAGIILLIIIGVLLMLIIAAVAGFLATR